METQQVTTVRIDVQSSAQDLREQTRARARQSVSFFLETICGVRTPEDFDRVLVNVRPSRLLLLGQGIVLWARLRGARSTALPHETVQWLFPELKDR